MVIFGNSMDCLRMDGKQGHVTCGNLVSNRTPGIISKICKLEGGTPALLRPVGTLQDFALLDMGKMTPAR